MVKIKAITAALSVILLAGLAVLAIQLRNKHNKRKRPCSYKTNDYKPGLEEIYEQYSAAVKFITAPDVFHKEILSSEFDQFDHPLHYHIRRIITDPEWETNLLSKDRDESLVKIHSKLGITKTKHSNPMYDIIDALARKIDEERYNSKFDLDLIFKGELYYQMKLKCKNSSFVHSERYTTIEATTDEGRRFSPNKSIDCEFLKHSNKYGIETPLAEHAKCCNSSWKSYLLPKEAIIFDCNCIDEKNSIKSMDHNAIINERKYNPATFTIKAILYVDKGENEKGVYKTKIFDTNENLKEQCEIFIENEKIQVVHLLYEREYNAFHCTWYQRSD
ncbi:hypothetical protein ENBRE01_2449 [Enteropsectra breve]|nr:hypothetical protein ENBRE01_2449 [Enteropsectra breve]